MTRPGSILLMVIAALAATGSGFQRNTSVTPKTSPFVEERAAADLQTLVGFGPRPAGSEAIVKARTYIVAELRKVGLTPQVSEFDTPTPRGFRHMGNIRAVRPGSKGTRTIAITGHYDTKFFENI